MRAGAGHVRGAYPHSSKGFVVRPLRVADLPAVVAIERASFLSPWSEEMLAEEIAQHQGVSLAAARPGDVVAAYVLCRLYGDMWHVLSLAVAPKERRRGAGRLLMERFLALADTTGVPATLEVRPSNHAAVGLYEQIGFEIAGTRRGYYGDTGEDALMMTRPVATLTACRQVQGGGGGRGEPC